MKDKLVAGALARLMQSAPKKSLLVPKVDDPIKPALPQVVLESVIAWSSPLFGLCEGRVLMVEGEQILVEHAVIGAPSWILRKWIIREPGKEKLHARSNQS